jgi:hypothetical protein
VAQSEIEQRTDGLKDCEYPDHAPGFDPEKPDIHRYQNHGDHRRPGNAGEISREILFYSRNAQEY